MSNTDNVNKIFNDGERMVPFLSHADDELIRHYSSHNFFRKIINEDISRLKLDDITIFDLGFGTGYACYLYAKLKAVAKVQGIDVSKESLDWALENFNDPKIDYKLSDAVKYLSKAEKYTYIVTRHVLEHIEDGLNIINEDKYTNRLCINVPYDEGEGNPYHILKGIKESSFPSYANVEFFYEDRDGNTYDKKPKDIFINSIVYIASKDGVPRASSYFKFPFKAPMIDEIFTDLTEGNGRFVKNIIDIQSQRLKAEQNERRALVTKLDGQLESVKKEVISLKKELSTMRDSKKWIYANKIATAKNKIINRKSPSS